MGRRGPPPNPSVFGLIAGPRGRKAKPSREPKPPTGEPPMPAWLGKIARDEWRRIVPILSQLRVLTVADGAALASYCTAVGELSECTRIIEKEGRIIDKPVFDRNGQQVGTRKAVNPILAMQRDAFARVKQFISEFGLSPASRVRVKTEPAELNDAIGDLINRSQRNNASPDDE